jgi:PD-(D/E)XK nuclease superfamily
MTITLTHSDLATFLTCRRKFDLAYINDFGKPEAVVGPLALGTRVHASIEAMHRDGTDPIDEHQRLALHDERWLIDSGAPSWDVDQLYEDIIFGRNCIDAYTEWVAAEGPYDGYKIHPEQMLEGLICGGQVLLKGKADLLLEREDDGWLFIEDLKTASVHSRTSLPALLEKSYQHHVYMVLAHLTHPEQIIGGASYTVLYKVKVPLRATHPMVESIPAHATWRQAATKLRQIEQIAYEIIRMMEHRDDIGSALAYPSPQELCRWCQFRHPCDLLDDNPLGARALLDAEFVRGHRHDRYTKEKSA